MTDAAADWRMRAGAAAIWRLWSEQWPLDPRDPAMWQQGPPWPQMGACPPWTNWPHSPSRTRLWSGAPAWQPLGGKAGPHGKGKGRKGAGRGPRPGAYICERCASGGRVVGPHSGRGRTASRGQSQDHSRGPSHGGTSRDPSRSHSRRPGESPSWGPRRGPSRRLSCDPSRDAGAREQQEAGGAAQSSAAASSGEPFRSGSAARRRSSPTQAERWLERGLRERSRARGRYGELAEEADEPGIDWEAVDRLKREFRIDDVLEGQFEDEDEGEEGEAPAEGADAGVEGPGTTVMLRNLPESYLRHNVLRLLADEGFGRSYDFLYMPIHFAFGFNFGYVFVNLISAEEAQRFYDHFDGFARWDSDKIAHVNWGETHRTLAQQILRYRNSPLLHPTVPDILKPCLFRDGHRVPFPPPTRRVRAPRARKTGRFSA